MNDLMDMNSSTLVANRGARAASRGGWVAPVLVVIAVLLLLAAGFGLRALLRADAAAEAARRTPAQRQAFQWPASQPVWPGAGIVSLVLAEEGYASVGDVRPEEWSRTDEVRFIDPDGRILAHGSVQAIVKGRLHVKYAPEPGAPRLPQEGDRAIRTGKTLPESRPAPRQ